MDGLGGKKPERRGSPVNVYFAGKPGLITISLLIIDPNNPPKMTNFWDGEMANILSWWTYRLLAACGDVSFGSFSILPWK